MRNVISTYSDVCSMLMLSYLRTHLQRLSHFFDRMFATGGQIVNITAVSALNSSVRRQFQVDRYVIIHVEPGVQ